MEKKILSKEEVIMEFQIMQQRAQQLNSQIEAIDKQIKEMEQILESVEELDKNQEGEILAPLGKGIFIKSKTIDKKLFVNVGSGIVIKRNQKETSSIIKNQIEKLIEMKEEYAKEIMQISSHVEELISHLR